MEYLLGIDNGGTVTKAAIYSTSGEEVATDSRKMETLYPRPAHRERDLSEFWAGNARVIVISPLLPRCEMYGIVDDEN